MRTESGRCLIFAMQVVSGYLARLARAARRVQGPRTGTFRKLEPTPYSCASANSSSAINSGRALGL